MSANLVAEEVAVAVTGAIYRAPLGTARPASPSANPDAVYMGLGYANEDGVEETHEDTINRIVAWQNSVVVRSVRADSSSRMAFTLIQNRGSVLETYHPGSEMADVGGVATLEVKPPTTDRAVYMWDMIDGDKHYRIWAGNAEVTERGAIVYNNQGEPIGYPVTVECYPDEDGNLMVKMSDDINWLIDIADAS
jgi:hypothetical protein